MDYVEDILAALRDRERFIRLTFSGAGKDAEWRKVVIRPVRRASGRTLQAVLHGSRKQVTQNIHPAGIEQRVREFLEGGFRHVHLQCTDGELHVRITRKGKALVARGKPSAPPPDETPPHDREKDYPFPANTPDAFLERIGVMRHGRVRAVMQDKFRQINHFLALLSHTRLLRKARPRAVRIVDCGCGRAFLTLAAYHYLKDKVGIAVDLVGVDADAEVVASTERLRDRVGYDEITFVCARIRDYEPDVPPQMVLSLHACDTATDEAVAQGVRWGAKAILCVPCCQHELHRKIARPAFRAALRHGILRERMADILTDALRAAALRVMGYRAEVIEFISPGHTAKNLMIRAEKTRGIRIERAAQEYRQLRDYWQVTPCIEDLLGDAFRERIRP